MPVPVSSAERNGRLRTGQRAVLENVLLQVIASLLIDVIALVAALGKPIDAMTFGDFGDKFLAAVVGSRFRYQEVHVIFDRYEPNSIKAGTKERRMKTTRPIRRVIEDRNAPLPST